MTVKEYHLRFSWPVSALARRAGVANKTINRIEAGEPVYDNTLSSVARAI